jgi:hypothetical protein
MIYASQVVELILKSQNPGQLALATRKLNAYVIQQEHKGINAVRTRAAIKAVVTRKKRK